MSHNGVTRVFPLIVWQNDGGKIRRAGQVKGLSLGIHDAHEVAAPDLGDVGVGEALGQEAEGDLDHLAGRLAADEAAAAVEVGADADVIWADEPDDVHDVADGVAEGGTVRIVVVDESAIKADLHHATLCG